MLPQPKPSYPRWKTASVRPIWAKASSHTWNILLDPVSFWQVFGTWEGEAIVFDDWQVAHLRDHSRLRAIEKSPQIGFSWCSALEAVWEAVVFMHSTAGFVSVDQREAANKVLYAMKAYAELPGFIRDEVPLAKDSTEELWFGERTAPSRIMSIPNTSALRGRRMTNLYLDETEYYKDGGKDAFRVAMGRITRGGRLTIGSTVFGAGTMLDNIMQGEERNFSRARYPWSVVEREEDRESILIAKDELAPEDFAEEYECIRGGGAGDTFTPDLLRTAQHDGVWIEPEDLTPNPEGQVLGYDVGTSMHPSILCGLEKTGDAWLQRTLKEYRGVSLPDQTKTLQILLRKLPSSRLVIDAGGIGLNSAQALESEFGKRVTALHPSGHMTRPDAKGELVNELRRAMEASELFLGADREQTLQFRRTRRLAGGKVEQPGTRKKVHYDRFWAVAYAWFGVSNMMPVRSIYEERGLTVVGIGR